MVDADPEMRAYVRRCLRPIDRSLGMVFEAADGIAALEIARREGVGLVIAEVVLPRLDGLSLSRRLRTVPGDATAVLLISGAVGAAEATAAGAGLVAKPFDGRTLRRQVADLLARRDPPRAR